MPLRRGDRSSVMARRRSPPAGRTGAVAMRSRPVRCPILALPSAPMTTHRSYTAGGGAGPRAPGRALRSCSSSPSSAAPGRRAPRPSRYRRCSTTSSPRRRGARPRGGARRLPDGARTVSRRGCAGASPTPTSATGTRRARASPRAGRSRTDAPAHHRPRRRDCSTSTSSPTEPMRPGGDVPADDPPRAGRAGSQCRRPPRPTGRAVAPRLRARPSDPPAGSCASALVADGRRSRGPRRPMPPASVVVLLDADGERTMLSQREPDSAGASATRSARRTWLVVSGYALLEPAAGISARAMRQRRVLLGRSLDAARCEGLGRTPPSRSRRTSSSSTSTRRAPSAGVAGRAAPSSREASRERLEAIAVVTHAGRRGRARRRAGGVEVSRGRRRAGGRHDRRRRRVRRCPRRRAGRRRIGPPTARTLARAMAAGTALATAVTRVAGAQGRVPGERPLGCANEPRRVPRASPTRSATPSPPADRWSRSSRALIAQGLPAPHNLETARAAEAAVRESGAVPATTAIEDGALVVGADRRSPRAAGRPGAGRCQGGSRDLGPLLASAGARLDHGERDDAHRAPRRHRMARHGWHRRRPPGRCDELRRLRATSTSWRPRRWRSSPRGPSRSSTCPRPSSCWRLAGFPSSATASTSCPSFYSVRSGLRLTHRVDSPAEAAAAHRRPSVGRGVRGHPRRPASPGRSRARPDRGRALDRRGSRQRGGPGRRRRCGHAPPARASRSCVGGPNARGERGADRRERAHRRADRCRGIGG